MESLENARHLFLAALEHHNQQRLAEAEGLYRKALEFAPERVSILSNLAAVLVGSGRYGEARELCERVLVLEPDHYETRTVLAACLRELAQPEAAARLLQGLLAVRPGDRQVHNNLGIVFGDLGRVDEAALSHDRALSLAPGDVDALVHHGRRMTSLGRPRAAFESLKQALELDPGSALARAGFIELACDAEFTAAEDPAFATHAIAAMSTPWCRPQRMAPVLVRLLWSDPEFRRWMDAASRAWPARLPLDGFPWAALFGNQVLVTLLQHAPIPHLGLERLLATLRYRLLRKVIYGAGEPDPKQTAFHCALARQCFINEYVYDLDDHEAQEARALQQACDAASASGEPFPGDWLAAVASYFPLSDLTACESLSARPWPAAIQALCAQQVLEPLEELRSRDTLPRLTAISDPVSLQVRAQYEQHPYPRWVGIAPSPQPQSIDAYLRRRFPGSTYRPRTRDAVAAVLVAGCGTGQHPIETALRFSRVEVLAVDLSLASLAYAARMAARAGVANIRFAQADILEIGALAERFDLIESDGVLHHMREPARGLANLSALLAEGGVMKLALYSEQARQAVVAVRRLIAASGYRANAEDIRQCRAEIMRLGDDRLEKQVAGIADFYTLSECRDLLFHVQEHRFSIPVIAAWLADAGLEFIGFELTARELAGFRKAFPHEASLYRLDDWHQYEQRNPGMFLGMYQFWAQRAGAAA